MSEGRECCECGEINYHDSYGGETGECMVELGICFSCAFWTLRNKESSPVIIAGRMYALGCGGGGGMGGRRFDIKLSDGEEVSTHDLWHRGEIPEHFRERMPDNASFMNGGEACDSGGITCFNPSSD